MRGFLRFGACDGFLWLLWKEESRNKDLGGGGGGVVRWNFVFQVFVCWVPVLSQVLR